MSFLLLTTLLAACGGDRGTIAEWCRVEAAEGARGAGALESESAGAAGAERRPEQVVSEGVGAELRLEELWRAGGTREGEHLAYPAGAFASGGGRVAIPDFVLAAVTVVEEDGSWLGSWAEEGSGPGELTGPVAAAWRGDGVLGVFDIASSRVVFLEGDRLVGEQPVSRQVTGPVVASGRVPWAGAQPSGGILLLPTARPLDGDAGSGLRTQPLLRVAPGSATADTLVLDTVRVLAGERFGGWPLPGEPSLNAAVGPDGQVAVAGMDERYRIVVMDPSGAPIRVICRDARPFAVSRRERGLVPGLQAPPPLVSLIRSARVADRPAATGHLFYGAAGRLWVQRNRRAPLSTTPLPGVAGAIHDVFDSTGTFVGTVTAPEGIHLLTGRGDTVWGLGRGAADEIWVVALEVEGG